jgi:D-alanyl-lipoteichoic acid acyltransferase DltB (MBOAT superfamily)
MTARLDFGFRLPEKLDWPVPSASPRESWQRWHISLSTWLRG